MLNHSYPNNRVKISTPLTLSIQNCWTVFSVFRRLFQEDLDTGEKRGD